MTWERMAVIGRIALAHGIRGQVIVNLETDFPQERFRPGAELFVKRPGSAADIERLTITTARFQQGRPVIGLEGVHDMNAAIALAGAELGVPIESLTALPADTFYHHDLIDCAVETVDGRQVGVVTGVEGTSGGSRLVVSGTAGDVQVPLVAEICRSIDTEAKRIVIAPPEGLLDLNAGKAERRS